MTQAVRFDRYGDVDVLNVAEVPDPVAGPGGGTATKPVGLVHFALARRDGVVTAVERRFGDLGRGPVRLASVDSGTKALSDIATASLSTACKCAYTRLPPTSCPLSSHIHFIRVSVSRRSLPLTDRISL